jgi:predicted Zn-dependent protease
MMQQATLMEPQEWRYGLHLVELLNNSQSYKEALKVSTAYHRKFPKNYILTLAQVRTLLLGKEYVRAEKELEEVTILPFEGATEGHRYYVQTKLMLAYQFILEKKYKEFGRW